MALFAAGAHYMAAAEVFAFLHAAGTSHDGGRASSVSGGGSEAIATRRGIGTLGQALTLSPRSKFAANAAGIPFTQGMLMRVLLVSATYCVRVWVMRYARKVRAHPEAFYRGG